jgi:hypothetical protein
LFVQKAVGASPFANMMGDQDESLATYFKDPHKGVNLLVDLVNLKDYKYDC